MLGAAVLGAGIAAFVPTSDSRCVLELGATAARCTTGHSTLLAHEGPTLFIPLGIAAAIAALGLAWRTHRGALVAAVLLTLFTLAAAVSIGMFFLPAVVLAWLTAYKTSARSAAK